MNIRTHEIKHEPKKFDSQVVFASRRPTFEISDRNLLSRYLIEFFPLRYTFEIYRLAARERIFDTC